MEEMKNINMSYMENVIIILVSWTLYRYGVVATLWNSTKHVSSTSTSWFSESS